MKISLGELARFLLAVAIVVCVSVLCHLYMATSLPGAQVFYAFYCDRGAKKANWPLVEFPNLLLLRVQAGFLISVERRWLGALVRAVIASLGGSALLIGLLVFYGAIGLTPPPSFARRIPPVVAMFAFYSFALFVAAFFGWANRREEKLFADDMCTPRESIRRVACLDDGEPVRIKRWLRVELINGFFEILAPSRIPDFLKQLEPALPDLAHQIARERNRRGRNRAGKGAPPHETEIYRKGAPFPRAGESRTRPSSN